MWKGAVQRFENCLVAVENVHSVLGEIAHLDAGAEVDRALIGRIRAGCEFQKRRFARAIGACQTDFMAGMQLEAGIFNQHFYATCEVEILELNQSGLFICCALSKGQRRHFK